MSKNPLQFKLKLKNPFASLKSSNKLNRRAVRSDKFGFKSIFTNFELRNKILFTLFIVVVYRLLAAIPLPGIDVKIFQEVFGSSAITSVWNTVTGGRLDSPSVVGIGLGAYISASIVIQLLTTIIPKLEQLSKEGERGRKMINQYTRLFAIPMNIVQAIAVYSILKTAASADSTVAALMAGVTLMDIITMVAALTAGGMILMWLSELVTQNGIGNGSSIIIAVGILAGMPSLFATDFTLLARDLSLLISTWNLNILISPNFITFYVVMFGLALMIWFVGYITEATRKLPIQYANRVRSAQVGANSFLPLKINQAGVMPVIFAQTILTFPVFIASLLMNSNNTEGWTYKVGSWINTSFFNLNTTSSTNDYFMYNGVLFLMIIAFSFFYTFVTFKPVETADNLKKSAGFIPGIRPGKETEQLLTKVMIRLTTVGSAFLALIALIPVLLRLIPALQNIALLQGIGGTALLIVVGVVVDTIRQMKSVSVSKSYDQFK